MKIKLVLGILLPIVLIIALVILGSWPSGFSMNENFEKTIEFSDIYPPTYSNNAFRIGEVTITNDYFLSKRIDAPIYLACLYDADSVRPIKDAGYVFYNEGDYSQTVQVLDLTQVGSSLEYYSPYSSVSKNTRVNVEVPSYKTKKLQVYFTSQQYYYSYSQNLGANLDYDQLILIKVKNGNPSSCDQSTSEDLQNAIRISINKINNFCTDTDDQYSSNDISSQMRTSGTCTNVINSRSSSYADFCVDESTLKEYYCSEDNSCKSQTVSCGPDKCSYGRCSY